MMKSSGIGNTHHGDWQCIIQRGSIQLRRYAKSTLNHIAGDSITVHHTYNVALYNYAKNTSNHTARDSITGSVSYVQCGSIQLRQKHIKSHRKGQYNWQCIICTMWLYTTTPKTHQITLQGTV